MDITQILIEYKGVFAAILGSLSMYIVTTLLKNYGKLNYNIENWKIIFYKQDEELGLCPVSNLEEALHCEYSFDLILYNSSDNPKSLRDIKMTFENGNNILLGMALKESSTLKYSIGGTSSKVDDIKVINIPPRQMINVKLQGYLNEENYSLIKNKDINLILTTKNYKNKLHKKFISVLETRN